MLELTFILAGAGLAYLANSADKKKRMIWMKNRVGSTTTGGR